MIHSDEYSTMAVCNDKKMGKTKKRTTWIPKTGIAAVAAAIPVAVPGVGWKVAWLLLV